MSQKDKIGREEFVGFALNAISRFKPVDTQSKIVALVGPWGSGKSWVLQGIKPALSEITREFNPWLYSDESGLFRGFATLIIQEIQDRKGRKRVAKSLKYIGPSMKGLGFDISGTIAVAERSLRVASSPAEVRKQITKGLNPSNAPYIIVDDLDRLTPDELIMFFKLLRLVGDLPGFVYILAFDQDTLIHLLTQTDVARNSPNRARAYLDKVIDLKLHLPPLRSAEKAALALPDLIRFATKMNDDLDRDTYSDRVENLLWPFFDSIRPIRRFVAAVLSLQEPLHGELNPLDWTLMTFLRDFDPEVYALVLKHRDTFLGNVPLFGMNVNELRHSQSKEIERQIESVDSALGLAESRLAVLDYLFPAFAISRKSTREIHERDDLSANQRVASNEYFDRYIKYDGLGWRTSDGFVDERLIEFSHTKSLTSTPVIELIEKWQTAPQDVLQIIRRRWVSRIDAATLFPLIEKLWSDPVANSYSVGVFNATGATELRLFATELLRWFSPDELSDLMPQVSEKYSADNLVSSIVLRQNSPEGSKQFVEWVDQARESLGKTIEKLLRSTPILPENHADLDLEISMLRYLDKTQYKRVSKTALADGRWTAVDSLSHEIKIRRGKASPRYWISGDLLTDESWVTLLQEHSMQPYSSSWKNETELIAALDSGEEPSSRELAQFILNDWDARSHPASDNDDGY